MGNKKNVLCLDCFFFRQVNASKLVQVQPQLAGVSIDRWETHKMELHLMKSCVIICFYILLLLLYLIIDY